MTCVDARLSQHHPFIVHALEAEAVQARIYVRLDVDFAKARVVNLMDYRNVGDAVGGRSGRSFGGGRFLLNTVPR